MKPVCPKPLFGAMLASALLAACAEEDTLTACEEHPAECVEHPTLARDLGDVSSFYQLFETDDEAATFYTELDRTVVAGATGRAPVTPIELDDPRYEQVRAIASAVHGAYAQLYPALQALPPPNVVLLPVAEANAAAVPATELSARKLPNLFFVNEGMLDLLEPLDDAGVRRALTGLIGHELAHLYFRHADRAVLAEITRAYMQDPSQDEALGFIEAFKAEDAELTSAVTSYQTLAVRLGPLDGAEFSGVPFGAGVDSALIDLIARRKDDSPACVDANAAFDAWLEFSKRISNKIGLLGEAVKPTDAEIAEGFPLSDAMLKAARTCLDDEPPRYGEALGALIGGPPDALVAAFASSGLEQRYLSVDNNIDRLIEVFAFFFELQAMSEDSLDLVHTRIYLKEEEADDVAMLIETELPKQYRSPQPGGVIEALFRSLTDLTPECEAALAADEAPEYALFSDHHSTCYRVFHARRMKALLAEQK